jgi:hypothetical protein
MNGAVKTNKMEQRGHETAQLDEKSGLLAKNGQIEDPIRTLRKRKYVLRGMVVALVAFVWMSATAIESLLSRAPPRFGQEKGNGDHVEFQDVFPQLDIKRVIQG